MFSNNLLMAAAGGGDAGYVIENSLLLNDDDSPYMSKTLSTPTSSTKFSFSVWYKRGNITTQMFLLGASPTNGYIMFQDDKITFYPTLGSGYQLVTTPMYRDPTAWQHGLFVYDSDNGTANDRMKMYINGTEVTVFGTRTNPASGTASSINSAVEHRIGEPVHESGKHWDGYLSQICLIDGQVLDATSFGEFDDQGYWRPIDLSGLTFGTNGFLLDFAVAPGTGDGAGTDVSGNDNHFTDSGLTASDQVSDTPTNDAENGIGNYCTWNPPASPSATFTAGNLAATGFNTAVATDKVCGTIPLPLTGKHYFEVHSTGYTGDDCSVGIMPIEVQDGRSYNAGDNFVLYQANVTPSVWPYFQTLIDGVTTNTDQPQINNTAFV